MRDIDYTDLRHLAKQNERILKELEEMRDGHARTRKLINDVTEVIIGTMVIQFILLALGVAVYWLARHWHWI